MKRQRLVDYLKALFVILVIITHSGVMNEKSTLYLLSVVQAVPCFMVLSGYTFALTAENKSICQMYDAKNLLRKFLRFTIPTLVTYIIYLVGWSVAGKDQLGTGDVIYRFVMGLYGPGGYYYGMMVQFLVLAPILFLLIRKYDTKGIILVGGTTFLFELFCSIIHIDENIYRVLIFRYLLFLAMGMYLYIHKNDTVRKSVLVMFMMIGVAYLLIPSCCEYQRKLFTRWSDTSMMTIFYLYPILYVIFHKFGTIQMRGWIGTVLEVIGQSSYHIMYVQLIYYVGVKDVLYQIFNLGLLGNLMEVMVAIIISVVGGIIFYYADNKIFGHLYKKRNVERLG